MPSTAEIDYAPLFNALSHFSKDPQSLYTAISPILSSYRGEKSIEDSLLAILDKLSGEDRYDVARFIIRDNPLTDDSLSARALQKASNSIESLPAAQQCDAFQWVWNNAEKGSFLEINALEKAFASIEHIKKSEQYTEAKRVFNNAEKNNPVRIKALEKALNSIEHLRENIQYEAIKYIYENTPEAHPLGGRALRMAFYTIQVLDSTLDTTSNEYYPSDWLNKKCWVWKNIPKDDHALCRTVGNSLLDSIKSSEPDSQYTHAQWLLSNTPKDFLPIRLKAVEMVWNSTIIDAEEAKLARYKMTQWVWENAPETSPIKAQSMEKLIKFTEAFDPPNPDNPEMHNQYNAACWIREKTQAGELIDERITAIISKYEEPNDQAPEETMGQREFMLRLKGLTL